MIEAPPLWPHQDRALTELAQLDSRDDVRSVCVVSPTGGGKTRVMTERAKLWAMQGKRVVIYTNRRILTDQTAATLTRHGMEYGMLAAGRGSDWSQMIQVARMQTIGSRTLASQVWPLPEADLVQIDEAHSQCGPTAQEVIARHLDCGARIEGYTATPIGKEFASVYKQLVVCGTNSELRRCGSLVPCKVFSPSEDAGGGVKTKRWRDERGDLFTQSSCYAHVIEHWRRLNPQALPTLVWAPGRAESRWFVSEFERLGFTAGHIDGQTDDKVREQTFEASQDGRLQVICSCGVLREGVDLPWIMHGILVQPCHQLKDYLQMVGRLLRACPDRGKEWCLLQDHAGAAWRHGSPNLDREWKLGNTEKDIARLTMEARQRGDLPDPICCPKCRGVRSKGPKCPYCGYEHAQGERMVLMENGDLKPVKPDQRKKAGTKPPNLATWIECLYAGVNANRTVDQAAISYKKQTGKWPRGYEGLPEWGDPRRKMKVADVFPHIKPRRKAE